MLWEKEFVTKGRLVNSGLVLMTVMLTFSSFGCGRRLAQLERNQLKLQKVIEKNSVELARNSETIRQNQKELKDSISTIQLSNEQIAAKAEAIESAQAKLEDLIQKSNHEITSNTIENSEKIMNKLSATAERQQRKIEAFQKDTRAVAANVAGLVNDLEQFETGLTENLTHSFSAIEEKQSKLNSGIETLQVNFNELSANIDVVRKNQNKLWTNFENENQKVRTDILEALEHLNSMISKLSPPEEMSYESPVAAETNQEQTGYTE